MEENNILESVSAQLSSYLNSKGLRKTPERFAILEQIYNLNRHFDVDTLYEIMQESGYRVSRATVYNTVDLLVECHLIVKHQFGTNMAHYERAFNADNHFHLICTNCNNVTEVKDEDLNNQLQNKKYKDFDATGYNLYIYGLCHKCVEKDRSNDNTIHN